MKAMEPLSYLHLQLRLEGKGLASTCLLRQIEIVPDEEVPLMLSAQLANEELVAYYAEALPSALQKELAATQIVFPNMEPLLEVLMSHRLQVEMGHYKYSNLG
jgi:hypothetical protein